MLRTRRVGNKAARRLDAASEAGQRIMPVPFFHPRVSRSDSGSAASNHPMSTPHVVRRGPAEAACRREWHFSHSVACGKFRSRHPAFGDEDAACRLDLLHWTRGGRGLHFDVLLREAANFGTSQAVSSAHSNAGSSDMFANTDRTHVA